MTIETEVAALTTATTDLLAAVNVGKETLDQSVATATTKAGEAADSAAAAAATVDAVTIKAGEAADSATAAATTLDAVTTAHTDVMAAKIDVLDAKAEIRNAYYGPLAADPTTRPDGAAMQVGDEYHNSTTHARKVYNGADWIDVSNQALLGAGGAALVGYGADTVEGALDARLPEIASYAALRAYSGPLTGFYVRGVASLFDGGAGVFRVDAADTTSADNGGTVLVDAAGRRWRREQTAGAADLTSTALGVKSDGTDQLESLLNALSVANGEGKPLVIDAEHTVSPVTLPANARVVFKGGILKAVAAGPLLSIGDGAEVVDAALDLGLVSSRGIYASAVSGFALKGRTHIKDAAQGGAAYNGGVILDSCHDFDVEDIFCESLNQNGAGVAGLYRALDLSNCTRFRVGGVRAHNCDMGVNLYASNDFEIDSVAGRNLSDNLFYIVSASQNGVIHTVDGVDVEEGIVLNSSADNANIAIGSARLQNASNKGLTLRTGGGYHIGNLTMVEASIAQDSGFVGCGKLTIGSLNAYMTSAARRPVTLLGNNGVTVGAADIYVAETLGGYPVLITDCDDITVGVITITGLTAPIANGVRVTDGGAPVASPKITIGELRTRNVTLAYNLLNAGKGDVLISNGTERYAQSVKVSYNGAAALVLENRQLSLSAGDVLGKLEIVSSDASGPGVKFTIEAQADGGTAAAGKTVIKNDQGSVVARIGANQGMAVKPPTSNVGLESGMLWNNAGTLAIVP